jgi:protein subunit release factor A
MREETYMAERERLVSSIQQNHRRKDDKLALVQKESDPGLKQMYELEAQKAQEQIDKFEAKLADLDRRYERLEQRS